MKKPKTKAMLIPYINEEQNGIRLGGFQHGIARDIIVDQPFNLLELLKDLNGENHIEYIAKKYDMSLPEILEVLEELKRAGVIYENLFLKYNFSKEEAIYYDRNINFFAWIDVDGIYYNYWEVQNKLKNSKVLLLGAGGTGGSCGISLARMGYGNITIVDFDRVELSNLNRQVFTYNDIGKCKVKSLTDIISNINPFIKVTGITKKINNLDDLLEIGKEFDLVICCIDKPANINTIMEQYTKVTGIPRILGGYASTVLTNSLFTESSGSFTELFKNDSEKNYNSKNVNVNVNGWEWENAVISPVSYISGNFSALYALYYITNLKAISHGEVTHIDLYNIQNDFFTYTIYQNKALERK